MNGKEDSNFTGKNLMEALIQACADAAESIFPNKPTQITIGFEDHKHHRSIVFPFVVLGSEGGR